MKPNAPESVRIVAVNHVEKPTEIERLLMVAIQGIIVEMVNHVVFPAYDYKVEMQLSGDFEQDFTVIDITGAMKEYYLENKIKEILSPYVYTYRFIFNRCEDDGTHLRILLQRFTVDVEHINVFYKYPRKVRKND